MLQKKNAKTIFEEGLTRLKDTSIQNPRLDCMLLFEKATQINRIDLICNPDQLISLEQSDYFISLIQRRTTYEPISHILGMREFWSLPFFVTKDTLDPRPDSETLINASIEQFADKQKMLKILDLGTGTGCLLISLLKEYPNAFGLGVDISYKTLQITQKNINYHNLSDKAYLLNTNWTEAINTTFDLIISNPPYIPLKDKDILQPDVRLFDPEKALYGGDDGLICYRQIAKIVKPFLAPKGRIILELGIHQKDDVVSIFQKNGFNYFKSQKDLQNIDRALIIY
ncbi:MAG: peptide chain release factor N(5)-glutamine methyltransferase [Alphaproteobacteria bacterium]|nr:peptide chain release factor N(5)-glutamine methyltransferase [Alphaproteobacteria bacterium]